MYNISLFKTVMTVLLTLITALMPGITYLPPLDSGDNVIRTGSYSLNYDPEKGCFSAAKNDVTLFSEAFCEYVRDGKTVSSKDYQNFEISKNKTALGTEISVQMSGDGLWDLTQSFSFTAGRDWFTTRVTLSSPEGAETNRIVPLAIEGRNIQTFKPRWTNILEVPFDNDGWAEFKVRKLCDKTESFEVGTIFSPDGGGLVLGSLEHSVWKSAVKTAGKGTKLGEVRLFSGATDPKQGGEEHGTVSGESVSSPLMFVGVFDDWREGLDEFARANTALTPKRASVTESVPFGWNSWGSVQTNLSYDIAIKTSDYIKEKLQPAWNADGSAVYVNLDSYLDNLSDQELRSFVSHCRENGQKVGVYFSPFVSWWDEYGMSVNYVPGTNRSVTYADIRLKKSSGEYYGNEFDGCIPLDVTHPATKLHVKDRIEKLKEAGFDYIKLDFLVHASFEGDFFNEDIRTGIEAYNYAMTYLSEMIGDEVFINLAMSPIFPYQYANGRRLACDAFYGIGDTEYTLNSLTYGFWEKELYDYPDPDHLVVWGKDAKATEAEARSRVTSGAISGTSFLAGDDFVNPAGDADKAFNRFEKLLTNPEVISVAKLGRAFKPVVKYASKKSANVFRLETEEGVYLAVFNYSKIRQVFTVDTGISGFKAKELWSGKEISGSKFLTVTLPAGDAALFRLTEK